MSVALEFAPSVSVPERARPFGGGAAPAPLASVTVLHRPSGPAALAPLRLTSRGVIVLSALTGVLALVLVWFARASAPSPAPSGPVPQSVTVAPGDTLWSIATRLAPQRDPQAEVAALQRRNHLADVELVPGQVLAVP